MEAEEKPNIDNKFIKFKTNDNTSADNTLFCDKTNNKNLVGIKLNEAETGWKNIKSDIPKIKTY
jgi:hypothetical protein